MPGTEELLARLQQLENGYYGDKEAARQQSFMDTYGSRFSNNRGLGMAILNELDARGIDTSAADEAVQQILDQLRTECNEIIESIKEVQQNAIDNAQKVEEISNVVSQVAAGNPDMGGGMPPIDPGMSAAPETPGLDVMDPNAPFDPSMVPDNTEQMPEEQMPEEPMPEEQMPEEPMPEEQMPPDTTLSDSRMKRIKGAFSKVRSRRNSYKPSSGILSAAKGGL